MSQPPYGPTDRFRQPPAHQSQPAAYGPPPGYQPGYQRPPARTPQVGWLAVVLVLGLLVIALLLGGILASTRESPDPMPPPPSAPQRPTPTAPQTSWGSTPTPTPTPTPPPTTEVPVMEYADSTDGRFRVNLGAPLWRDGVLPWQPYVGEAVENDLISVTTDGIVSIRVALEDWTAGPEITPESIQQQLINNGTPPGFMAGDPPPITIAGAVPLGAAYDTPFVYMNTYYLELVGDQAVVVLISANNKAEADELVAWADGRIVRL